MNDTMENYGEDDSLMEYAQQELENQAGLQQDSVSIIPKGKEKFSIKASMPSCIICCTNCSMVCFVVMGIIQFGSFNGNRGGPHCRNFQASLISYS